MTEDKKADVMLSTDEFWEKMCDPRFFRIDINAGRIEGTVYRCAVPPEGVTGFIVGKVAEAIKLLGL